MFVRPRARRGAAAGLACLLLLGASACSSKKPAATPSGSPSAPPSPSAPAEVAASFPLTGVHPYDAQDRAGANAVANDVAHHVIDVVDAYYNIAFLQPSRWHGGTHAELPGLFTSDAAPTVGPNLQALSLDQAAAGLSKVTPGAEAAGTVGVLIEANQSASYATVATHFEGTGQPSASGGTTVKVVVDAQFFITVDRYQIAGYDITTSINGQPKGASYHPPAQGTV